jgi:dienelactone hydrolase
MTQGAPICKACVTGFLHDGTPKGTVETIANLQTYVSKPTSSKQNPGIIVIIPDIFGWTFNNNRLLADEYAEKAGRIVYLPDFMFGTSLSAMLKMAGDVPQSSVMDVLDPIDDSKPSIFQKMYAPMILVDG